MKNNDGIGNVNSRGLTVVIPVYNAEKYIEDCVSSVLNQIYNNLEIICIDDGSTDASVNIIKALCCNDKRIKLIQNNHRGVSIARNIGINNASMPYITFVDADDSIDNCMYSEMMKYITEHSLECAMCGYASFNGNVLNSITLFNYDNNMIFDSNNKIIEYIVRPMLGFSKNNSSAFCQVWNKIFSLDVIRKNELYFNEKRSHAEDWQFCLEFFSKASRIGLIQKPYYHYIRRNNTSLVSAYRDDFFEAILEDRKRFKKMFPDLEWNDFNKVKSLDESLIDAVIYYRLHLKPSELRIKFKEILRLAKSNNLYEYPINRFDDSVKKAITTSNYKKFSYLMYRKTNFIVFKNKSFTTFKKLLHFVKTF